MRLREENGPHTPSEPHVSVSLPHRPFAVMTTGRIDIRQMVDEINRMPDRPSLKRNTDGSFHDISGPPHDVSDVSHSRVSNC